MLDNIHLIGTSHIAKGSLDDIKKKFLSVEPDIICVELDKERLHTLLNPNQKQKFSLQLVRTIGVRGYLFALVGRWVQQKLGKMVGMQPGSDMLYGYQLAKNNNLELALIDRSIQQTIRELMKKMSFFEWMRIGGDLISGFLPFRKKKKVKVDLNNVPQEELIETLMTQMKDRYPTIWKVLVDKRNHYMARQLVVISKKNPSKKILAIVGAGHKKGMEDLLSVYDKKIEFV